MNFTYLGHNFTINKVSKNTTIRWYICTKCKIKYYCGEFVTGFSGFGNYNKGIDLDHITCDELIIKSIIE
jgi:hypothetical protein